MKKILTLVVAALCCATMFATEGALNGRFTINEDGDQIFFSQGNLQYVGTWQFAMNQWESFGTSQSDDHRDLFGWGTGDAPNKVSTDNADYPAYTEWGTNEISNVVNEANSWRTLTNDEWHFLLFKRTNADDLCKMGSIDGVNGAILYPDGWSLSTTQTILSSEEWSVIEAKGACFLPVTGRRKGSSVERLDVGSYWTSELYEDPDAYCIGFTAGVGFSGFITFNDKYIGQAVRLVKDVDTTPIENVDVTTKVSKTFRDGVLLIEKNGKFYNATGAEVK